MFGQPPHRHERNLCDRQKVDPAVSLRGEGPEVRNDRHYRYGVKIRGDRSRSVLQRGRRKLAQLLRRRYPLRATVSGDKLPPPSQRAVCGTTIFPPTRSPGRRRPCCAVGSPEHAGVSCACANSRRHARQEAISAFGHKVGRCRKTSMVIAGSRRCGEATGLAFVPHLRLRGITILQHAPSDGNIRSTVPPSS